MDRALMDEEEEKAADRRRSWLTIAFGIVIIIIITGSIIYDHIKPLPNNDYCKDHGFEAGTTYGENILCYKECSSNTIDSCLIVNAVRT